MEFELVWELFGLSLIALVAVSASAPVLGAFLFVRRAGFHGVVLPQCATTGVALGYFVVPWWVATIGLDDHSIEEVIADPHYLEGYLQGWAVGGALVGAWWAATAERVRGAEAAWLAVLFAVSTSLTMFLRAKAPFAGEAVDALMGGEILLLDEHGLVIVIATVALVFAALFALRLPLLLEVTAPEVARLETASFRATRWLFPLVTAGFIGVGVSMVGPYTTFGSLVIPPLAARPFVRSFRGFVGLSVLLGLAAGIGGAWLSLSTFDVPLGPSVVMVGAVTLLPRLGWRGRGE